MQCIDMGKSVSKNIRTQAAELMEKFPEKLSAEFGTNKEFLDGLDIGVNKHTRNLIAGHATRTKKAAQQA